MPIGSSLAGMFGRSPIKPIQEHMKKCHQCAELLIPFTESVLAGRWEQALELQQKIASVEREADVFKRDIRKQLPKSLFLPMPREDLLDLVSTQDKVANKAKDIAGLMYGRHMEIPADLAEPILRFVRGSVAASSQAVKAIGELDELIETGFGGHEVKLVEKLIEELDVLEHDTDEQQIEIRLALFKVEKQMYPVDVIFLYQVIEQIGDLANRAQRVGGQLQMLLAR
ncbi:MAG: TIGR00153 family protein [Pseudomonadota bacterium]